MLTALKPLESALLLLQIDKYFKYSKDIQKMLAIR